jgi:hypothetical protein
MRVIVSVPKTDQQAALEKLRQDGWKEEKVGLHDPTFSHPDVPNEEVARQRLHSIGLDPHWLIIDMHPEDDFTDTIKP